MAAPLVPISLTPWGGQSVVTTETNTFTWQSDGTQTAFYIEWVRNIAGASSSNTGWQTSSLEEYEFASGTFTNTYEYKWRVKVRNVSGQESAYSDWAVFIAGNEAELTITYPATDLDVLEELPVYQHSYTSPNGYTQVAYQYKLFTGTTWDDIDALTASEQESYTWDELEALGIGSLLWDSGRVESTATSVEQPSEYLQILQYWYKVQVTIWDSADNEITSAIRTFGLLVNSVPKLPVILDGESDPDNGQNIVHIFNPDPAIGQVATAYNRLYRRKIDGTWELVEDNIAAAGFYSLVTQPSPFVGLDPDTETVTGYDKSCRGGYTEEYAVSAVGTNDVEGSKSDSIFITCNLNSFWLTNTTTNTTVKLQANPKLGRMTSERRREEYYPLDEQYPVIQYDGQRYYRGSFNGLLLLPDGTTWPQYVAEIRSVLDADTPSFIILRSPYGDLFEVDVYDFKIVPYHRADQMRSISFSFVEVAEQIPVGVYVYESPTDESAYWIIDPDTDLGFNLYAGASWSGHTVERDRMEFVGLNSLMVSVGYGNKKAVRSGFSGMIVAPESGSLADEVNKLRDLVDGIIKKPLLFRTPSGDELLVDAYNFSYEIYDRMNQVRKVSFEFIEIGGVS